MRTARYSFIASIILSLLFLFLFNFCKSDSDSPTEAAASNLSGMWTGTISSNLLATPAAITITITQNNKSLTGTYSVVTGASGSFSGTLNNSSITFSLVQTTPNCLGTFSGQGTFNGTSFTFTYSGSDCWGSHNGAGNLTKYDSNAEVICPLYVGAAWNYVDSTFSSTGTFLSADSSRLGIIGKGNFLYQNQNLEFFFWNWINPKTNKPSNYSWLERNDADGLSVYGGYFRNQPTILVKSLSAKFPVNAGDIWYSQRIVFNTTDSTFKGSDTLKISCVSTNETFKTPAGIFNCYLYTYQRKYTSGGQTYTDDSYLYYVKNKGYVGLVSKTNGTVRYKKSLKR